MVLREQYSTKATLRELNKCFCAVTEWEDEEKRGDGRFDYQNHSIFTITMMNHHFHVFLVCLHSGLEIGAVEPLEEMSSFSFELLDNSLISLSFLFLQGTSP